MSSQRPVRVDVVSDVVCPWCFIGKRRLEKEIAAHPVTRCEPGVRNPSYSRPGWSSKPLIPLSEQIIAEGIASKMRGKVKAKS